MIYHCDLSVTVLGAILKRKSETLYFTEQGDEQTFTYSERMNVRAMYWLKVKRIMKNAIVLKVVKWTKYV